MGPGRWGTRDDIRLGVKVAYSDINNTSMLIEIAKMKNGYTPELSFGTHFFQDLVESQIFYLPLYPEEKANIFNSDFLENADNVLSRFLPEYSHISHILRIINLRESRNGKILRVLMNSDEEKAVGFLTDGNISSSIQEQKLNVNFSEAQNWRMRMAEAFAQSVNINKYNISGIYLAGSVFKSNAGPDSDIDIFIHTNGDNKENLLLWAEGWNSSLSSINFNRTGFKVEKVLDVTVFNDQDIDSNQFFRDLTNPVLHKSKKLV
jgi:predicted nucleotidyltransferase